MERPGTPPLGIRRLISESFRVLVSKFGTLFPLAFVPALVLTGVTWMFQPPIPDPGDPLAGAPALTDMGAFVAGIFSALASFFVVAFMCLAALDAVLGKRHSVAQYVTQSVRHLPPLIGLGLVLSIATGFGLILFVIPGLYVIARYLPWVQTVVFEDAGWSGIGRAQELTEGYRWPLMGAVLAVALVVLAIAVLLSPVAGLIAGAGILGVLIEAVFAALYYALMAIFTALAYLRLREIKEGTSLPQISGEIG
jgi:hypothetical protein